MTFLPRTIVALAALALGSVACAEPPIVDSDEDLPAANAPKDRSSPEDKGDKDRDLPLQVQSADECSDACTAGAKRCSATSGGGTEICARGSNGCTAWTQGADCAAGSSCDATKNDGSCVAGCTNDAGCSATNVGAENCSAEGGRTRIACTKVGACFRWASAPSCSPDEACHAGKCESTCTNACTLNAVRCASARGRESCVKGVDGCTAWKATTGCSPDEQCSGGACQ
ncbi:MAG: hypothetical protein U0270_40900 [Labilithrix sp.]